MRESRGSGWVEVARLRFSPSGKAVSLRVKAAPVPDDTAILVSFHEEAARPTEVMDASDPS